MAVEQVLTRGWLRDAQQQYEAEKTEIEDEVGECMQSCCQRDLKNQVYTERMVDRLRTLDPAKIAQRSSLRPSVGLTAQLAPPPEAGQAALDPCSSLDADTRAPQQRVASAQSATDAELEELRIVRLARIRRAQAVQRAAFAEGHGSLLDVDVDTAEAVLSDAEAPAVFHLYEPGLGCETDEALHRLAEEYVGTRFVRLPAARAGTLLAAIRRPVGAWVVAARKGRIVGVSAAVESKDGEGEGLAPGRDDSDESSDFGSDDLSSWDERLKGWLQGLRVLRRKVAVLDASSAPEQGGSSDASDGEETTAHNEWDEPCPLCGRTYYHVHKSAVRRGGSVGSDDDGN